MRAGKARVALVVARYSSHLATRGDGARCS